MAPVRSGITDVSDHCGTYGVCHMRTRVLGAHTCVSCVDWFCKCALLTKLPVARNGQETARDRRAAPRQLLLIYIYVKDLEEFEVETQHPSSTPTRHICRSPACRLLFTRTRTKGVVLKRFLHTCKRCKVETWWELLLWRSVS